MSSYVPCKKNDSNGCIFYVSLISQADTKLFQANPTLAAGDVKIAKDDGAPANLGTLPAVDGDFTKRVKVTLSQAETNGDNLTVIFSDAAGAEWADVEINIQTAAQTLDEMDVNIDDIETDTNEIQGKLPTNKFMGSSDGADDDGTLNSILEDTGTTIPGTITTVDNEIATIDTVVDGIQTDLNNGTDGLGALKDLIDALQDPTVGAIADAVWDEVLTGATHNLPTSAGRRLRTAGGALIVREETCQAGGGNNEVILDAGASGVDDTYNDDLILLVDGTGAGQVRHVEDYDQASKTCTVDSDWLVNPDATTDYVIIARSSVHVHKFEADAKTEINDEMVDVLGTDTISELTQGIPTATPTITTALMLIYMALRKENTLR